LGYGALEIADSVRTIIRNWAATSMPLIDDAESGDYVIEIQNTNRYRIGDEVLIRDPTSAAEFNNIVEEKVDKTHIRLVNPLENNWPLTRSPYLTKTYDTQMINGIYIGDPGNIPMYPAITVNVTSRDSEWLTIDSTKDTYNIEINVYLKQSTMEKGYRSHIKLAETIIWGLKKNIYPLIAPYESVASISDISATDTFIKVFDTSDFNEWSRGVIESEWNYSEFWIDKVIDDETLLLRSPAACEFLVEDNTQVILFSRFIYNSWPASTSYGDVYKGTLLKAAKIKWFAWEEELWCYPPRETFIH